MVKSFLVVLLILLNMQLFSQGRTSVVSGFIYDATNGEALIGANVLVKNTQLGATTNLSGFFAVPNVPAGERTLIFTYLGYKTYQKVITVKPDNDLVKVFLEPDILSTGEVVISGDSARTIDKLFAKPVSRIELNSAQINSIPRVIEADLLRSLQSLPGIQPLSDFSSALYIRGGTPDQNLYLIDGTDVYNPEHAFGLFSTFNTNAIKKIELSKGGFGAEYGGRLSSVLNVTNLDGNRNNLQGDVSVSLISASTTLQAPLGSIGSISGSFRRTYIDQTYAKFVDEIPDYYFYDGNLKAFLDLGEKDKLVLSFYGGQDKLDFKFDKEASNSLGFKYDWGNVTGSVNWKRIFSNNLFANFWVTGSRFSSHFKFSDLNVLEENLIEDVSVKGNLEYYYDKDFNLVFGFEEKTLHGQFFQNFPGGKVDVSAFRNHYIGYVKTKWYPVNSLEIEAGLRTDYFQSDKDYHSFDPRFTTKYRLTETSNLKLSAGIYHQYLNRIPRMFLASIWTSADMDTKGSTAYHLILGYQKEISQIYELEIEAYYKKYEDIYSFNYNFLTEVQPARYEDNKPVYGNTKGLFNRGDGNSVGLEVLLRKDYGAVTGWIGYSLSRTENIVDGLNQGESFIPRHNRTSTVNGFFNINIGEFWAEIWGKNYEKGKSNWTLGLNYVYSSGQPITLPASVYVSSAFPGWSYDERSIALYPQDLNESTLPAYTRLDLSLTYEKQYDGWSIAPYLQIFNIGNRKNVWFINYENVIEEGQIKQQAEAINMIPLLPSIGINIKF